MPDPDIESSVISQEDERRLGSLAAGALERLGGDAREMLDSRIERTDLQAGPAAHIAFQGRNQLDKDVMGEHSMSHRLGSGSEADLDASLSEGLELERELPGEESSRRRDERSRCRSSGSRGMRSERRRPIRSWSWSGSVRHQAGRKAVRVPRRRRLVTRTRAAVVAQIRATGGRRLLRRCAAAEVSSAVRAGRRLASSSI